MENLSMEYMYASEYINDGNHLLSLKIVKDFYVKSGLQVIIVLLAMLSIITSRSEMRSATISTDICNFHKS